MKYCKARNHRLFCVSCRWIRRRKFLSIWWKLVQEFRRLNPVVKLLSIWPVFNNPHVFGVSFIFNNTNHNKNHNNKFTLNFNWACRDCAWENKLWRQWHDTLVLVLVGCGRWSFTGDVGNSINDCGQQIQGDSPRRKYWFYFYAHYCTALLNNFSVLPTPPVGF